MMPSPFARGQAQVLPGQTLVSVDELAFFDRAKRHIDNKILHQEFLKLLNLFTQDLIDIPTLVDRAWLFIGSSDQLFSEFKSLVGWDPTAHGLVDGEEWMVENIDALDRPRVDLNSLKHYGPSYKRLPPSEVELACSGRDALCWSVLNDDWVAHATWVSAVAL
jgi:paired amphipathic helix protein Sin3a